MKPGATIYVYHTGFLPAAIRGAMKVWRLMIGRKYSLPWNHTDKIIAISVNTWYQYFIKEYGYPKLIDTFYIDGWTKILMSCSARKDGAEMIPLSIYLKDHPVHHIKTPVCELTINQLNVLENYAIAMCFTNKRKYEKVMFLKWLLRIRTLGGYNPKHTDDKQVYCYEIVNDFDKLIGLAPDRDGLVDIYMLWENPNFE